MFGKSIQSLNKYPLNNTYRVNAGLINSLNKRFYVRVVHDNDTPVSVTQPWIDMNKTVQSSFLVGDNPSLQIEIEKLLTIDECTAFFSSYSLKLKPPELTILLKRIHDIFISKYRVQTKGWNNNRRKLFNDRHFIKLISEITRTLDKFGPKDFTRVVSYLNSLEFPDKGFFRVCEPFAANHLPSITPSAFVALMESLVNQRVASSLLIDRAMKTVLHIAPHMSDAALASWCELSANAPSHQISSLEAVSMYLPSRIPNMRPKQLCMIAYAFARHPSAERPTGIPLSLVALLQLVKTLPPPSKMDAIASSLPVSAAVKALWASSKLGSSVQLPLGNRVSNDEVPAQQEESSTVDTDNNMNELSMKLLPYITSRIKYLSPTDVSIALWSCKKSKINDYPSLKILETRALEKLNRMTPQGLAMSLSAIAEGSGRVLMDETSLTSDTTAFDQAEERVIRSIKYFNSHSLAAVLHAFALARAGSQEFWSTAHDAAVGEALSFSPEEIVRVLTSFANVRSGSRLFSILQPVILERLLQFTQPDLCDLTWAFSVSRFYDSSFWQMLLTALRPETVASQPECCLLYPCLMDLGQVFPWMDPPGRRMYLTYTKEAFWDWQLRMEFATQFADDVANVFETAGLSSALQMDDQGDAASKVQVCADVDGFLVDIYLPELQLAILCHSPLTLHQKLDIPLGSAVLKSRYLKGKGIRVVHLENAVWTSYGNDVEKAKYLASEILSVLESPAPSLRVPANGRTWHDATSGFGDFTFPVIKESSPSKASERDFLTLLSGDADYARALSLDFGNSASIIGTSIIRHEVKDTKNDDISYSSGDRRVSIDEITGKFKISGAKERNAVACDKKDLNEAPFQLSSPKRGEHHEELAISHHDDVRKQTGGGERFQRTRSFAFVDQQHEISTEGSIETDEILHDEVLAQLKELEFKMKEATKIHQQSLKNTKEELKSNSPVEPPPTQRRRLRRQVRSARTISEEDGETLASRSSETNNDLRQTTTTTQDSKVVEDDEIFGETEGRYEATNVYPMSHLREKPRRRGAEKSPSFDVSSSGNDTIQSSGEMYPSPSVGDAAQWLRSGWVKENEFLMKTDKFGEIVANLKEQNKNDDAATWSFSSHPPTVRSWSSSIEGGESVRQNYQKLTIRQSARKRRENDSLEILKVVGEDEVEKGSIEEISDKLDFDSLKNWKNRRKI